MLKLERRACVLGSSINTRTQKHGEEDVAAMDIRVNRFVLTPEELDEVLLSKNAHKMLYVSKKGRPDEPRFEPLAAMMFREKVKDVSVVMYVGRSTIKMPRTNFASLNLVLNPGGLTWWSFQIQWVPEVLDANVELLLGKMNQGVELAITCEHYGEPNPLPMEEEIEVQVNDEIQEDFIDGPLDEQEPLIGAKPARRPRAKSSRKKK